jgi:hypothetical protein
MSRPNPATEASAPLLTGPADDGDLEDSPGPKRIRIFNRTITVFRLGVILVGVLALIAIGISIAAIGIDSIINQPAPCPLLPSSSSALD